MYNSNGIYLQGRRIASPIPGTSLSREDILKGAKNAPFEKLEKLRDAYASLIKDRDLRKEALSIINKRLLGMPV